MTIFGNEARRRHEASRALDRLPKRARRALEAAADRATIGPGRVALADGVAVRWLFVVLDGELVLREQGTDRRILGPGSIYGALEMLSGEHAAGALVSRDVTTFLTIPKSRFAALAASEPGFADWVLRTLAAGRTQAA